MPRFITLRPGLKLAVMPRDGTPAGSLDAQLRRVTADSLRIDLAPRREPHVDPAPGDALTLIVQMHGRIYNFATRVREALGAPADVLVVDLPAAVEHGERRQFYRLLTDITPEYAARVTVDGDEIAPLDARITDISGGGLQLRVKQWVPVGARLRLVFFIDDSPMKLDVAALALSVLRPDARRSYYRVNGRFIEPAVAAQEQIVRYVFRRQREFQNKWAA